MTSVQTKAKQWVYICLSYCTYVDEVAFAVQHDVAIVSVFDLQQEQQEAVGGHAADEVIPSLWTGEEDIRTSSYEIPSGTVTNAQEKPFK